MGSEINLFSKGQKLLRKPKWMKLLKDLELNVSVQICTKNMTTQILIRFRKLKELK